MVRALAERRACWAACRSGGSIRAWTRCENGLVVAVTETVRRTRMSRRLADALEEALT